MNRNFRTISWISELPSTNPLGPYGVRGPLVKKPWFRPNSPTINIGIRLTESVRMFSPKFSVSSRVYSIIIQGTDARRFFSGQLLSANHPHRGRTPKRRHIGSWPKFHIRRQYRCVLHAIILTRSVTLAETQTTIYARRTRVTRNLAVQ